MRRPYRVGDRIRIGDATGDVIDVSYLDTTLWEFGGDYLSTDHPSGRIIKFPNTNVLDDAGLQLLVAALSLHLERDQVPVAYESDLEFVAQTMQECRGGARRGDDASASRVYRELLAETPVDHLEVHERPAVFFRVDDNTWLEAIVRYLVEPARRAA